MQAEIDAIHNQRIDNLRLTVNKIFKAKPQENVQRKTLYAREALSGSQYRIWVDKTGEEGKPGYTRAEFLTRGRGKFSAFVFFRQNAKGGKALIHGIPEYSLIKEIEKTYYEEI